MSTPPGEPGAAARPPWLIDRDLDAVAAHIDPWILAAEPDHDARTTSTLPALGHYRLPPQAVVRSGSTNPSASLRAWRNAMRGALGGDLGGQPGGDDHRLALGEAGEHVQGDVRVARDLVRGHPLRRAEQRELAHNACRRRPKPERDQRRWGGGLDR
jgi:hypothetical protein